MMSNVGGALSLYRVNKEESVLLRLTEERERESILPQIILLQFLINYP